MSENQKGRVMPFRMSGTRLRARAQEYRRRGQALEALTLVRRAAVQDDTAAAWQALAAELRRLGNWEPAAVILGRVLSRSDAAPSAWLDMARCMLALDKRETAEDCLYHLLHEDPWSSEGDAARELLQSMDEETEQEDDRRLQLLVHRAMKAWQSGDHALAMRRVRRAMRLSRHKERLLTTMALLCMYEGQERQALRWMAKAVRIAPKNALVLCTMAALLQQANKRRVARGFLRQAAQHCADARQEERFCTTAWMMNAWPELEAFLQSRLTRTPYRLLLLHARATMQHECGCGDEAQETWKLILSVDPEDRRAAAMLTWAQSHPRDFMQPGQLPKAELAHQRLALTDAEMLFTPGSDARRVLDWCVASEQQQEILLALATAKAHPDRAAEIRWLRELLTRPDVQEECRQQALMRLAALQHFETVNVLVAGRYVQAQCQPTQTSPNRRLWHMFLPEFLRSSARWERLPEMTAFAAQVWAVMSMQEKQDAVAAQTPLWTRLMRGLWLWRQGRMIEALDELTPKDIPLRRFTRLANNLLIRLENTLGTAGEGET